MRPGVSLVDRQREQERFLKLIGLLHRQRAVIRTSTLRGFRVAKDQGLLVELLQTPKGTCGEKGRAQIQDGALHATLLISAAHRDGPRLEAVVHREVPVARMEAHRVADALQHCGLEIVVQEHARYAAEEFEGELMTLQKQTLRLAQKEADVQHARVTEHHDKRRQLAQRAPAEHLAKGAPVHLRFLAGQRLPTQEGLRGRPRTQAAAQRAKVAGTADVAALADHLQKARSGQIGIARKRLLDEG